uniref:RNA-directed RNA polymerase n=1 Tax=Riiser virus TaxID=2707256 RepID=A0A6H0DH34_9VIRU|nr:MAG: RNA-dependent RNA polymerase [Riiser virus]
MLSSTIRAYQSTLRTFRFEEPKTFSEDFAQKRYLKKLEEPDPTHAAARAQRCWEEWLAHDEGLPQIRLPAGFWYRVRHQLHEVLRAYADGPADLPQGSEFAPTRGNNSCEAKLSASRWTVTYDAFEAFAKIVYNHSGLKRAARQRFTRYCRINNLNPLDVNFSLYDEVTSSGHEGASIGFILFSRKLEMICEFVHGSRFTTVPKNNEKDRPIEVGPFGNLLVQRSIGNGIRRLLKDVYQVDLDTLADRHRRVIEHHTRWATIDLKNASSSIGVSLVEFLFPPWFVRKLMDARVQGVYGPDWFYFTKQIGAMGNGFTFELMTLILTAAVKQLDKAGTVFGDDIIINPSDAPFLIEMLEEVGFQVNKEKSFISGPFRESCGANFHAAEGYIESYDFEWPESIGDCVLICNKAYRLARIYPSFQKLYECLLKVTPRALQGGPCLEFAKADLLSLVGKGFLPGTKSTWEFTLADILGQGTPAPITFPAFFVTPNVRKVRPKADVLKALTALQYGANAFYVVRGFEFKSKLRTPVLKHLHPKRHWAKYLMYLDSCRKAKDVITHKGEWKDVYFITDGVRVFRARNL